MQLPLYAVIGTALVVLLVGLLTGCDLKFVAKHMLSLAAVSFLLGLAAEAILDGPRTTARQDLAAKPMLHRVTRS